MTYTSLSNKNGFFRSVGFKHCLWSFDHRFGGKINMLHLIWGKLGLGLDNLELLGKFFNMHVPMEKMHEMNFISLVSVVICCLS